jgi:hypothetical protein
MSNISDFKSQLTGGGARPNLFKCKVFFPPELSTDTLTKLGSFMIKGAQLPSSVIAPVEVPYLGRKLKVAGDRTFEPWTITVINDENMLIRNAFETWMDLINDNKSNTSAYSAKGEALNYMRPVEVEQLGRDGAGHGLSSGFGEAIKRYKLIDAFPTNISAIDLNYESTDVIEEFTVEFNYQYWVSNTTAAVTDAN